MTDNPCPLPMVPQDVMLACAARTRELRLGQNVTQKELAGRVGVAEGTVKRFEKTGEAQFRTVLGIALALGHLEDFTGLFKAPDVPAAPYRRKPQKLRQRARKRKENR